MSFLNLLFGFSGRIGRSTFWFAHLAVIGLWVVFLLIYGTSLGAFIDPAKIQSKSSAAATLSAILGPLAIMLLLSMWMNAALAVKRLHDRDKSFLWAIAMFSPNIVFWLIVLTAGFATAMASAFTWLSIFQVVATLWYLIELGFFPGTEGPNQFGPDPGDPSAPGLAQFARADARAARAEAQSQQAFERAEAAMMAAAARAQASTGAVTGSRAPRTPASGAGQGTGPQPVRPRPAAPSGFGRRKPA